MYFEDLHTEISNDLNRPLMTACLSGAAELADSAARKNVVHASTVEN